MTGAGGRRGLRRWVSVTACALVAGSAVGFAPLSDGPPSASAAPAPPWPTDPWDAGIAADWGSGAGRVADAGVLDLTVDAVTPQVPTVSGRLAARVTVTNTSDSAVGNIMIRAQRAERLPGSSQARTVLAEPEATYAVATSFGDSFSLAAGESATLTLEVALDVAAPAGLGVAEPGVYPLLFNANGRPDEGIDQFLAETRFLLPVRADDAPEDEEGAEGTDGPDGPEGESGTAPEAPESPDAARDDAPADPVPMSLVWPLATNVPLLPGETGEAPERQRLILSDESLHEELAERGRLGGLLGALESELAGPAGPGLRQSTCVAVDPELIQTVDRMVDGYSVGDRRPSPVESSTRLRDSWGDADSLDFTEGSGAETAAQWLDRLRAITRDMCVVTLPWSGAEINAVSATGDPDLAAEALSVGDGVVADILELEPLAPVVLPPEGYLSATAAPTLRYADPTGAVDPNAVFEAIHGTAGAGTWPSEGAAPATALVTANSLTPDDGGLAHAGESVDLQGHARAFALPGSLSAALAATGSAPEVAGYSAVSGRHDLTADSGVARMQTSVGTLHQELSDASIRAGDGGAAPVVALPPAGWSVDGEEARTFLRAVAATFDEGIARPVGLGEALETSAADHSAGPATTAAPNPDPGGVTGTEMTWARQQSGYLTDLALMMANDPQVAMTRHGFTQPLRRDVLRMLTGTGRRERAGHVAATERAAAIHGGTGSMLQQLRDSVTLVAPGGVYTRTTGLSPVVVVGRNGLPLPVPAEVQVLGQNGVPLSRQPAALPAKGSVTLQLNSPTESDEDRRARLQLWLETPAGQRISAPVEIVVQTGPGPAGVILPLALIGLAVGAFYVGRSGKFPRFQRFDRIRPQWGRD